MMMSMIAPVELYDYLSQKKGSMMPAREGEVAPDYVLTVKSSKDKNKNAALLYCIDSHAYTQIKSVPDMTGLSLTRLPGTEIKARSLRSRIMISLFLHWLSSTFPYPNTKML